MDPRAYSGCTAANTGIMCSAFSSDGLFFFLFFFSGERDRDRIWIWGDHARAGKLSIISAFTLQCSRAGLCLLWAVLSSKYRICLSKSKTLSKQVLCPWWTTKNPDRQIFVKTALVDDWCMVSRSAVWVTFFTLTLHWSLKSIVNQSCH